MTEYRLIRSGRRTVELSVRPDGEVWVRAPRRLKKSVIDELVAGRAEWIQKKQKAMAARPPEPDDKTLALFREQAAAVIPERVAYYAALMGLVPGAVKINAARTRFGSCSPSGNLNFSCRLMGYPAAAVDYVVVHELAHLRHRNHGKEFYALIATVLPDYKERIALLKTGG